MPKPTFIQTLLGQPSQKYTFPPQKNYYSNKAEMIRIAAEEDNVSFRPQSVRTSNLTRVRTVTKPDDDDESDNDIFYTPDTSPRASVSTDSTTGAFRSRSASSTSSSSSLFSSDSSTRITSPTYTDEDWLNDSTSLPRFMPVSKRKPKASATMMMSMTALLEEDEDGDGTNVNILAPRSTVLINTSRQRVNSAKIRSHRRSSHSSSSHKSLHRRRSRSLEDLPQSSLPSNGTPGYTSLTLPRAPQLAFSTIPRDDGKIDLTRSGVAQTTMASIEVVRGLSSRKSRMRRDREEAEGSLAFTSYRQPPDYVPGNCVLVQVWAVGLDGVDAKMAGVIPKGSRTRERPKRSRSLSLNSRSGSRHEKSSSLDSNSSNIQTPDVGFIPGRSFVGRVLECGWDVKEEIVRKGEWVIGLLDVKKSGSLQEFILADRHRIHRIPHSIIPNINSSSLQKLSFEELALLPLCGLPAHRAVRSFAQAFASSRSQSPFRALVLRGHTGAGAMATQMLVNRGWSVCVHAPLLLFESTTSEKEYMNTIESRVRSWGADEVVFEGYGGPDEDAGGIGDAVGVIERLIADGDIFHGVIDTVGGREIWEASERLLRVPTLTQETKIQSTPTQKGFMGSMRRKKTKTQSQPKTTRQFTTLIGDNPSRVVPTASDHFRAGLRSLKSNDEVGYAWISVGQDVDWEGEGIRDSLGTVLQMAIEGIRPFISAGAVIPFEKTPDVFTRQGPLADGGTVVAMVAT